MAITQVDSTTTKKDVSYINKDFSSIKLALQNLAKTYYPSTYNNFSEASMASMFMDMVAYTGDVLSLYIDNQLKESNITTADERKNVIRMANFLGYKHKSVIPSTVKLDVYQVVPAIGSGTSIVPDYNYAMTIDDGMIVSTETLTKKVYFLTDDPVNFKTSSSFDPTTVTPYTTDTSGNPTFYLLKKHVNAVAGEIKIHKETITTYEKYKSFTIPDTNVSYIVDVYDSNNNRWYEVDFLAQDMVKIDSKNTTTNDVALGQFLDSVPYLLTYKKVSKRFVTKRNENDELEIHFGAGQDYTIDEEIVPNPLNVGIGLRGLRKYSTDSLDPFSFMFSLTYGEVPNNTTLTIRYMTGGGVETNVPVGTVTKVDYFNSSFDDLTVDSTVVDYVKASVAVDNSEEPSTGGRSSESIEEIRQAAISFFASQCRAVTVDDYTARIYFMPSKYGCVSKVFVVKDDIMEKINASNMYQTNNDLKQLTNINQYSINIYCLGYDANKKLIALNTAIKENIKTYLNQYRMSSNIINIREPYIVNIGIDYEIVVFKNYNKKDVLKRCTEMLINYFDIDKWQIQQSINKSDIILQLALIDGVQSVKSINIINKYDTTLLYSGNIYDIGANTFDDVLYSSMDVSIFEIKSPSTDIVGSAS